MGKMMGNIVDLIGAPLSAAEVNISIILASMTRSLIICFFSVVVFHLFLDITIKNYFSLIFYLFISSFILGAFGIIAGLWAEKFDHMAAITNFVIVPLSFLSGTFFSIEKLPAIISNLSFYNPFFHFFNTINFFFPL